MTWNLTSSYGQFLIIQYSLQNLRFFDESIIARIKVILLNLMAAWDSKITRWLIHMCPYWWRIKTFHFLLTHDSSQVAHHLIIIVYFIFRDFTLHLLITIIIIHCHFPLYFFFLYLAMSRSVVWLISQSPRFYPFRWNFSCLKALVHSFVVWVFINRLISMPFYIHFSCASSYSI